MNDKSYEDLERGLSDELDALSKQLKRMKRQGLDKGPRGQALRDRRVMVERDLIKLQAEFRVPLEGGTTISPPAAQLGAPSIAGASTKRTIN